MPDAPDIVNNYSMSARWIYPTSASGIIVLLKTPPKYRELDPKKGPKNHAYALHFRRSLHLPTQMRFLIGGERVTSRGLNLSNSLGRIINN